MEAEENNDGFQIEPEFENGRAITFFEMYSLLQNKRIENYEDINGILTKTEALVNRFNKYGFHEDSEKRNGVIFKLRDIFNNYNFTNVEITQMIDLFPQNSDEAKSLIPSLGDKITDNDLQEIIEKLKNLAESKN